MNDDTTQDSEGGQADEAAVEGQGPASVEERAIEVLKTVFDPEIPVSIYALGLIYEIAHPEPHRLDVKMTLTAPGCPVAGTLPLEVENKLAMLEGIEEAKVELVWDPPWSPDLMSEEAKLELGFF